jgi:Gpi18-like mannosyltransferase
METQLFIFLMTLTVCLFSVRQYLLTGVALGLFFLTRGEGALLGPILVGAIFWKHRRDMKSDPFLPLSHASVLADLCMANLRTVYAELAPLEAIPGDGRHAQLLREFHYSS